MTQQWQTDLESWVAGWDAVRGDAPQQEVLVWSGEVPSGENHLVVCAPNGADTVRPAVQAAGREVAATEVLLMSDVQELDRGLGFPSEAGFFDAPMGDYSRFEVDEWGHPVAHSTLSDPRSQHR